MNTFITPAKAFAHLDRLQAWQHGETPAPVTVEWDLSNACSLSCQSCHMAYTHTAGPYASSAGGCGVGAAVIYFNANAILMIFDISDMALRRQISDAFLAATP